MLKVIRLVAYAAIAGVLVVVGAVLALRVLPGGDAEQKRIGGEFVLTAMDGSRFDSRTLAGRPHAIFFGFTHCPDVCPTTMSDLSATLKDLGPAAEGFPVLFVTVDPERDTPQLLKDYLSAFDPRLVGLTGTRAEIDAVIRAFGVVAVRSGEGEGYTYNHTVTVFLRDGQGRLAGAISPVEDGEARAAKIRRLLGA